MSILSNKKIYHRYHTVYFSPNGKDYTGYLEHGNIEL